MTEKFREVRGFPDESLSSSSSSSSLDMEELLDLSFMSSDINDPTSENCGIFTRKLEFDALHLEYLEFLDCSF